MGACSYRSDPGGDEGENGLPAMALLVERPGNGSCGYRWLVGLTHRRFPPEMVTGGMASLANSSFLGNRRAEEPCLPEPS